MRRFRRSTALRPISQDERRNADLFLAELLFGAERPPQVLPAFLERRPAGESLPEAGSEAPTTALPATAGQKAPARSPVLLAAISARLQAIDRHLSRRTQRGVARESWSGEDFVPTSVPGVGADFDSLISNLFDLESAAIKEHYTFEQRVSAFRKICYDSDSWDILIPGAKAVKAPASWSSGTLLQAWRNVKAQDTLDIQGKPTAIWHLFAGLDAGNYPVRPLDLRHWTFPVATISSNKAQATYAGDLGSVCYEYQKAVEVPMGPAVKNLDPDLMKRTFTTYVSDADMGGNADAFALVPDKSVTVVQNLFDYYTAPAPAGGIHLRWYHLMREIIGGGSGSAVSWELKDDVFSAAEAYAAGVKKDKAYILRLLMKPESLLLPTFSDFALHSATWTVDEFLDRAQVELHALQKSLAPTP